MINPRHMRVQVFGRFVEDLATLSKCDDKQVAAIIVDAEATQVLSIGINGGPKKGYDCLCRKGSKYTCAHAEANALVKCNQDCTGSLMICTLSPCITCATLIVNSGIAAVYYTRAYHDTEGLEILENAGIATAYIGDMLLRR